MNGIGYDTISNAKVHIREESGKSRKRAIIMLPTENDLRNVLELNDRPWDNSNPDKKVSLKRYEKHA